MLDLLFGLLIPLLWVAVVGFLCGWAGYLLGDRIICRCRSYAMSKNVSSLLAVMFAVAAWYGTFLLVDAWVFNGGIISVWASIAVVVAFVVASVSVPKRT